MGRPEHQEQNKGGKDGGESRCRAPQGPELLKHSRHLRGGHVPGVALPGLAGHRLCLPASRPLPGALPSETTTDTTAAVAAPRAATPRARAPTHLPSGWQQLPRRRGAPPTCLLGLASCHRQCCVRVTAISAHSRQRGGQKWPGNDGRGSAPPRLSPASISPPRWGFFPPLPSPPLSSTATKVPPSSRKLSPPNRVSHSLSHPPQVQRDAYLADRPLQPLLLPLEGNFLCPSSVSPPIMAWGWGGMSLFHNKVWQNALIK